VLRPWVTRIARANTSRKTLTGKEGKSSLSRKTFGSRGRSDGRFSVERLVGESSDVALVVRVGPLRKHGREAKLASSEEEDAKSLTLKTHHSVEGSSVPSSPKVSHRPYCRPELFTSDGY